MRENEALSAKARRIIFALLIFSGILLSLFYIPLFPTNSKEKVTDGKITFIDLNSNPLTGTIKISGTGIPGGQKENINSIIWSQVPNAVIDFDVFDKIGLSINFRIDEDSPYGRVIIQDHGQDKPANIHISAPGQPIKYVEIEARNVYFAEANVILRFTDDEITNINNTGLAIYIFDKSAKDWKELTTWIDLDNNTISATVDMMSVFAFGPHVPGIPIYIPDTARKNRSTFKEILSEELTDFSFSAKIDLRDSNDMPIAGHIRTYDKDKNIKTGKKTGIVSTNMDSGEIEVDALESKNVMVKLKVNSASDGKIILDDYGKRRPVQIPVPGKVVKYVEIGADNIVYSSAEITIRYSDAELEGTDENSLRIYHWNGVLWEPLSTAVDAGNNALSATTTTLSPFAVSAGGGVQALKVTTSRYSVFSPWTGKPAASALSTYFIAYALLIDTNGMPVSGANITFEIYSPAVKKATVFNITKQNGLANVSYDTINDFTTSTDTDYGTWNITAYLTSNSSVKNNVSMKIEAGGNAITTGAGCSEYYCHSSGTKEDNGYPRSPYTANYGQTDTRAEAAHDRSDHKDKGCYYCHPGYSTTKTGTYGNTSDVHKNRTCDFCHGNWDVVRDKGIPRMPDCIDAGCHPLFNKNLTNISSLANLAAGNAISVYSFNFDQKAPLTAHNGTNYSFNLSVPCIICHGPVHNITKPELLPSNTNNITEYTQCTTCHNAYLRHNDSVSCTVCHSQDAHAIKVFAQNATYINGSASSFRGNCTNCHQNSTFFGSLKTQARAGNYTGRDPPHIAVPSEHSNDDSAGTKWNQTPGYWTNSDQLTWCKYCHGETNHKSAALGRPSLWDGNNAVNSTIGNTSWCAGCHWQGYASGSNTSSDMVNTFINDSKPVPPEISGNATYGTNTSVYEYTDHSLYTKNDSTCNSCHGYGYGFTTITQLMHNQSRVGGPNCVDCHDLTGIVLLSHINVTTTNDTDAIHKNLNSGASAPGNNTPYYSNNKRCWACHGNGSEPSPNAHPSNYKTPYRCPDCHVPSESQNLNFTPNSTLLNVSEHYWNGTEIKTPAISTCYQCHNISGMLLSASDPDNGSDVVYNGANGGNISPSHYGKKRPDIRTGASANCTYCHQNASTVFTAAMVNTGNSTISNHSMGYNSSNPACTSSQCHNTGWMHNSTLAKPSISIPNSTFCLSCHGSNGSGGTNYSGAITGIKAKHNDTINCTECHLNTSRDIHLVKYLQSNASFSTINSTGVNCISCHQNSTVYSGLTRTPPKIPEPMYHSDNTSNGTAWNTTGYWTSNSTITSCIYCHNDTKHNTTALGRPGDWKGDNVVNGSINTSKWCSSCHYQGYSSGGKNYNNMTSAFLSWNLSVPPEITNGTYAPFNLSRYYNHFLTNYSDATCLLCHGTNISSNAGISAFLHNITWGSCTSCHYSFNAMNSTTHPDRFVDSGLYNTSLHRSLVCQNCHTKGHKNIGARKACEDCHAVQANPITDKDRHNITATPSTNMYGGESVVNITLCTTCHNSALYNNSINTYGYGKSKDCDYCHTYPDKNYN